MTLYVDVTNLYRHRLKSGIQRVVREFCMRSLDDVDVVLLVFDDSEKRFMVVDKTHVKSWLSSKGDHKQAHFLGILEIDSISGSVFFDMDNVWVSPLNRIDLYRMLRYNNNRVINYVYDIVPLVVPRYSHPNTVSGFTRYMTAVYTYSDLVICDSFFTERDVIRYGKRLGLDTQIDTTTIRLGDDFLVKRQKKEAVPEEKGLGPGKYLLFVGTIEPRKRHDTAIAAFEKISKKHKELSLVIVGKKGWVSDDYLQLLTENPLYRSGRIRWLQDISDEELALLYRYSLLCVYLSDYEGFGLPVSEALAYGKVVITTDGSSLYEVAQDLADYVHANSVEELCEAVERYLANPELLALREKQITQNYKSHPWDLVYSNIMKTIRNIDQTFVTPSQKLPLFLITNRPEKLQKLIANLSANASFVESITVVAPQATLEIIKDIDCFVPLRLFADEEVLGDRINVFRKSDHQLKNSMLRKIVISDDRFLESEEFIMLDDDNYLATPSSMSIFKAGDRYKAYYFGNSIQWHNYYTPYDDGQRVTKDYLISAGIETLQYSSHCMQIINKRLYREMLAFYGLDIKEASYDEWSIYFNYLATYYPKAIQKRVYATLGWPGKLSSWTPMFSRVGQIFVNDPEEYKSAVRLFDQSDYDETKRLVGLSDRAAHIGGVGYVRCVLDEQDYKVWVGGIPELLLGKKDTVGHIDVDISILTKELSGKMINIIAMYEKSAVRHVIGLDLGKLMMTSDDKTNTELYSFRFSLPIIFSKHVIGYDLLSLSVKFCCGTDHESEQYQLEATKQIKLLPDDDDSPRPARF